MIEKETLKNLFKEKDDLTYSVHAICNNCGHHQNVTIPKGITIKQKLSNVKCNFCKCQGLSQYSDIIH